LLRGERGGWGPCGWNAGGHGGEIKEKAPRKGVRAFRIEGGGWKKTSDSSAIVRRAGGARGGESTFSLVSWAGEWGWRL